MLVYSWKLFLHKSAQYEVSGSIYTNNSLTVCQSEGFYLISSLLPSRQSQCSVFSLQGTGLSSPPPWALWCFNDEQQSGCLGLAIFEAFYWGLDITHFHIIPTPRGFIALYPVCLNLEYPLIIDKVGKLQTALTSVHCQDNSITTA